MKVCGLAGFGGFGGALRYKKRGLSGIVEFGYLWYEEGVSDRGLRDRIAHPTCHFSTTVSFSIPCQQFLIP
jgi:hypothetical protein